MSIQNTSTKEQIIKEIHLLTSPEMIETSTFISQIKQENSKFYFKFSSLQDEFLKKKLIFEKNTLKEHIQNWIDYLIYDNINNEEVYFYNISNDFKGFIIFNIPSFFITSNEVAEGLLIGDLFYKNQVRIFKCSLLWYISCWNNKHSSVIEENLLKIRLKDVKIVYESINKEKADLILGKNIGLNEYNKEIQGLKSGGNSSHLELDKKQSPQKMSWRKKSDVEINNNIINNTNNNNGITIKGSNNEKNNNNDDKKINNVYSISNNTDNKPKAFNRARFNSAYEINNEKERKTLNNNIIYEKDDKERENNNKIKFYLEGKEIKFPEKNNNDKNEKGNITIENIINYYTNNLSSFNKDLITKNLSQFSNEIYKNGLHFLISEKKNMLLSINNEDNTQKKGILKRERAFTSYNVEIEKENSGLIKFDYSSKLIIF